MRLIRILSILLFFYHSFVLAQDSGSLVRQFIKWETEANPTVLKSSKALPIEHYEIPLDLIKTSFNENFDEATNRSLIFEKDGKKFVRWIIHPDDTKWHKKVKTFLRSQGFDSSTKNYFKGHYTSSRSLIVIDPTTGHEFGIKVSTNQTGGYWNSFKRQRWDDAKKIRAINDMFDHVEDSIGFQYFDIMSEHGAYGIANINQSMVVRSIDQMGISKRHYFPAFAAFDSEWGRKIAKLNGSKKPAQFWNKHLNKPLAKALAEMAATFGFTFNSPHSQNFLVELDENFKPTGKIILRDIGDLEVSRELMDQLGKKDIYKMFNPFFRTRKGFSMKMALIHGTKKPEWMSKDEYKKWGIEFFQTFEETFSSITGVDRSSLGPKTLKLGGSILPNGGKIDFDGASWFIKEYKLKGDKWTQWKEHLSSRLGWRKNNSSMRTGRCLEIILNKLVANHRLL